MGNYTKRKDDDMVSKLLKLMPLIVLIGGVIVGWTTLQADAGANKTAIQQNKADIMTTKVELNKVRETVIRIEERQLMVQRKQQEIGVDIKDILRVLNRRVPDR